MATTEAEIPTRNPVEQQLRWYADAYEQAQHVRIAVGEQIRAVLQGADSTWGVEGDPDVDADAVLAEILGHDTTGPVEILGRTYQRHHAEEREMYREMQAALKQHPAWPWLERVRGIGPTLACKLLARLDATKADHASSFFAYCGLATVPGERYRCETCGLVNGWPVGYKVTGKHQALHTKKACKGALVRVAGPDDGVRVAQPKSARGVPASYDAYAKKIMYLVGTSFLKAGPKSPYEQCYRASRATLEVERPGWPDGRKHLTALRKTEKLFLSHLWEVWREAIGLPTSEPYAMRVLGHDDHAKIRPWSMVEE